MAAADIGALDEHGHARVELMRARIAFKLNRGADAPSLLYTPRSDCSGWMPSWRGRPFWKHSWPPSTSGAWRMGAASGGGAGGEIRAVGALSRCRIRSLLVRGLAVRALDGYVAAAPLLKDALRQYLAQPRELDVLCHPYCVVAAELMGRGGLV